MKSKLPTLLLAAVVALALWVYVVTAVSPESEENYYNIPVTFENENVLLDRDLMLVSGSNAVVSVRLYGNRSDLNRLNQTNITVTVDLSGITEPGHYEREYRVTFPSGVTGVSIARRLTASVNIDVARSATKEVPVQLVTQGELQDGLIAGQPQFSAETVAVYGPEDEVEQISIAGIEVNYADLTSTLVGDYAYILMNENYEPVDVPNVTTDTGEIHLILPVEHFKEIPLEVTLVDGGGAVSANATCKIEPSTIIISGSEEALAKIDRWILASIDLGMVDAASGYGEELSIDLPNNLTNRSQIFTAEVTVRLSGLTTKALTLNQDQIQPQNVPDGLSARVFTQHIDVVVRGPAEEVNALTAESIVAMVDLSGMEPGNYDIPLTFTLNGVAQAGVYGRYSVSVGLTAEATGE